MSRPRSLTLCPWGCGASSMSSESSFAWKQAHKKDCRNYEEIAYRAAEDRMADHYAERDSLNDAVDSGRYSDDAA